MERRAGMLVPAPKSTWKLIEGLIQKAVVLQGAHLHFHFSWEACITLNKESRNARIDAMHIRPCSKYSRRQVRSGLELWIDRSGLDPSHSAEPSAQLLGL